MKPTKLNYEANEINRAPFVSLGIKYSDVKRCTRLRNEGKLLACALTLCNVDLDVPSSSN